MSIFHCDLSTSPAPLVHSWEHAVGSGHATLALRADWQAQLARAHRELGFRHVRFHGLLSDDVGTLVCHEGAFLNSFFNADVIVDALLGIGMRPFVELSFMPRALASGPQTVFHYEANVTPPADTGSWALLIEQLVAHWVERYGPDEVRHWYFEVWNEPNLEEFWTGSRKDYFCLYRETARAIKAVDPDLRVGGPATAVNAWIPEFLDFCDRHDVPVDFVSTHHYPTDAFGDPGDDTETQLAKSARGALRDQAAQAQREAAGRPLFYTEWNTSSNPRDPLHDQPYAAAVVARTVLNVAELVDGYAFWAFSDIFEEDYFPSLPFHGGFGLLNLHGVAKPSYRAFELLHSLGTERFAVRGRHPTVDVWVTRRSGAIDVVCTNHALPRHPISTETVVVKLTGVINRPRKVTIRRVDRDHAYAPAAWWAMGAPEYLSGDQVAELEAASCTQAQPHLCTCEDGTLTLDFSIPRQAVALLTISTR